MALIPAFKAKRFPMLLAIALLMANPAQASTDMAQGATTTYTPRSDVNSAGNTNDGAVPLDWAGPAARRPGADASVQQFDPDLSLFGTADMCVSIPGQPAPACAATPTGGLQITSDIFAGSNNPDATCQSVETIRMGADGKPQRVFATVCGDEAEAWSYRQRSTPSSRANPTRTSGRVIGPNDIVAPRSPSQ
jgi:hypothetical protein